MNREKERERLRKLGYPVPSFTERDNARVIQHIKAGEWVLAYLHFLRVFQINQEEIKTPEIVEAKRFCEEVLHLMPGRIIAADRRNDISIWRLWNLMSDKEKCTVFI